MNSRDSDSLSILSRLGGPGGAAWGRVRVSLGGSMHLSDSTPADAPRSRPSGRRGLIAVLLVAGLSAMAALAPRGGPLPDAVTLSIVGTTDLHGYVFPRDGRGGLALLGGYLANLRAARAADGGGVVLLDAGDTWLGGIESNMSEGAVVVDAYNALGYTAAAIGNHDLEYGAVDRWPFGEPSADDLRGALKARAAQARFPLLAANLLDQASGRPVAWPNVRPSVLVTVAGVRVGIVGVMTLDALSMTLAANVGGLATSPLVPAIADEATALRAGGAQIVVLVAHAGGACAAFGAPDDLTSCDDSAEIFDVARRLPHGTVDAIVAGHTHDALAHRVAGVPDRAGLLLGARVQPGRPAGDARNWRHRRRTRLPAAGGLRHAGRSGRLSIAGVGHLARSLRRPGRGAARSRRRSDGARARPRPGLARHTARRLGVDADRPRTRGRRIAARQSFCRRAGGRRARGRRRAQLRGGARWPARRSATGAADARCCCTICFPSTTVSWPSRSLAPIYARCSAITCGGRAGARARSASRDCASRSAVATASMR